MAPSLGLSLYLLSNRRPDSPRIARQDPPRPEGLVVWIGVEDAARQAVALSLADAILARGLADHVHLTSASPAEALPFGITCGHPPRDTLDEAHGFLDHWRPDIGVILGGQLRPALLSEAQSRGLALLIVEGTPPHLPDGRRWYPGLVSGLLDGVQAILASDEIALAEYRRAGAPPHRLHLSAPLRDPGLCPPVTEAERRALAQTFGTRPVWLAVSVPEDEETAVLSAHLTALRATHRLLLILVPLDPARGAALADLAQAMELTTARRSLDQDPDDDVQVYIADTDGEYGLWYRLSPVCYMGGTLFRGQSRSPFEAAALGSAIVHGPVLGGQEPAFVRLRRAGATRIVPSGGDLGDTVSDLLEPDRAARLAQAAWGVLGASSDATEDTLRRMADLLSARGGA